MARPRQKLSGWSRLAIVFSIAWVICVVGLAAYERYVAIGNVDGPWALYRNYSTLVFHHVDMRADSVSFWLLSQRFWTVLLLPIGISWAIAAFAPAVAWTRIGFVRRRRDTRAPSGDALGVPAKASPRVRVLVASLTGRANPALSRRGVGTGLGLSRPMQSSRARTRTGLTRKGGVVMAVGTNDRFAKQEILRDKNEPILGAGRRKPTLVCKRARKKRKRMTFR